MVSVYNALRTGQSQTHTRAILLKFYRRYKGFGRRLQFGFIFRIITSVGTLSLLYCKVYLVKFFLTTRTQAVYMTCISEKYTNRLSRNLYEGLVNYHLTPSRTELFL